jgi:uncharacterized protein (DUF779 family)
VRNSQNFEKRVLSKIRDICIGSIENTEFWVTRIYSNIGNMRIYLDVIDALVGGFSFETPY